MADNVFELYKPIKRFNRLLSLLPISQDNSLCSKLKQFVIISLLISASVPAIIYANTIHHLADSSILMNMDRASLAFNMILSMSIITTSRKQRYDYLKRLDDFDAAIGIYFKNQVGAQEQSKKALRMYLWHITVCYVYVLGECVMGYVEDDVLHYRFAFIIGLLLRTVTVFEFIAILNMTLWRFKYVNRIVAQLNQLKPTKNANKSDLLILSIGNLVEGGKPIHFSQVDIEKIRDTITILRLLHESLTLICIDLASVYGTFQAFGILTGLLEEVSHAFSIFIIGLHADELSDAAFYIGIIRAVLYMYVIGVTHFYFVFYYCSAVMTESSATKMLLQEFYLGTEHKQTVAENVRLFALQLRQTEIKFSAAGIFELDWSLMSLIVGEVSSYLIFFIQSSGFVFDDGNVNANATTNGKSVSVNSCPALEIEK